MWFILPVVRQVEVQVFIGCKTKGFTCPRLDCFLDKNKGSPVFQSNPFPERLVTEGRCLGGGWLFSKINFSMPIGIAVNPVLRGIQQVS